MSENENIVTITMNNGQVIECSSYEEITIDFEAKAVVRVNSAQTIFFNDCVSIVRDGEDILKELKNIEVILALDAGALSTDVEEGYKRIRICDNCGSGPFRNFLDGLQHFYKDHLGEPYSIKMVYMS